MGSFFSLFFWLDGKLGLKAVRHLRPLAPHADAPLHRLQSSPPLVFAVFFYHVCIITVVTEAYIIIIIIIIIIMNFLFIYI